MPNKKIIPKEKGIDHTLNLILEGYMYISNRCHSLHSNFFETRLLGKKTICMRGKEAVTLFYNNDKFKRNGAVPKRVVRSFFGKNSVQTLDTNSHYHRKNMLMSVMTNERILQLKTIIKQQWEKAIRLVPFVPIDLLLFPTIIKQQWEKAIDQWEQMEQVVLYEEVQQLLFRSACEWVGVPLDKKDVKTRTKEVASLYESAASIGPAYWAGRRARTNLNKWIGQLVQDIRSGKDRKAH